MVRIFPLSQIHGHLEGAPQPNCDDLLLGMSCWNLGSMVCRWAISLYPTDKWDILGWRNPLILTFDPNLLEHPTLPPFWRNTKWVPVKGWILDIYDVESYWWIPGGPTATQGGPTNPSALLLFVASWKTIFLSRNYLRLLFTLMEVGMVGIWCILLVHHSIPMTDPWDWNIYRYLVDFYGKSRQKHQSHMDLWDWVLYNNLDENLDAKTPHLQT